MKEYTIYWENEEFDDLEIIDAEYEEEAIEEAYKNIPADAIIKKVVEETKDDTYGWAPDTFRNLGLSQWDFL